MLTVFKLVNKYCYSRSKGHVFFKNFELCCELREGEGGINFLEIFYSMFVYLCVVGEFVEYILGKY